MGWRERLGVDDALHYFTTDRAVRAGVLQAAWSVAPSYARGLLPRSPLQQAGATGTIVAAQYAIGTTTWSALSSVAAGVPGSRPGKRALLVGATAAAVGGKTAEVALRPRAEESLPVAVGWAGSRMLAVAGLAGGLTTVGDIVTHDLMKLPRSPATTLAVDVALGGLMAGGTILRRMRRARKHGMVDPQRPAIEGGRDKVANTGTVLGIGFGTAVGLGALAVTEQAVARGVTGALNKAVEDDLGEVGALAGHAVVLSGFAGLGVWGLRRVRQRVQRRNEVMEPAYLEPPTSEFVSTGPRSIVEFDSIGKEGRRFVLMALTAPEITAVVNEPAMDPIRVVIGKKGSVHDRAIQAVSELERLGAFKRSLICVASPTGVGYVNYSAIEALEYLARGDCATVVPQYAMVPSALALDKTKDGSQLQAAVLEAITERFQRFPAESRPRLVQFGESLGAQVALDVPGKADLTRMAELGVESGLYLGVPFRSSTWRRWCQDPAEMDPQSRLVLVSEAGDLSPGSGRHVMICHHDDPINKFAYTMVVQPPAWMGAPETRPPKVPRETLFRPITTFVLTMVDVLNGMNTKPGEFRLVGHDYRIDLEQAISTTYDLPRTPDQAADIETNLREREQEWAKKRVIARAGEKALGQIRTKLTGWGQSTIEIPQMEPSDTPESALLRYLNDRLGSSGVGILGSTGAE